ncbi:hypothetical protein FKM82_000770 [Ascaphus truei]
MSFKSREEAQRRGGQCKGNMNPFPLGMACVGVQSLAPVLGKVGTFPGYFRADSAKKKGVDSLRAASCINNSEGVQSTSPRSSSKRGLYNDLLH